MSMKTIAIIGAGTSGITALKCCLDEGLNAICFERSDHVGGLWAYREDHQDLASVFKSTIINSSKEMMCFSDYPIPSDYPNFMHSLYVEKYFLKYVDRFDLKRHIMMRTEISTVEPTEDHDETGQWKITYLTKEDGKVFTKVFDSVMLCTGHHATPNVPSFKGLSQFQGRVVHTHDYKTPYDLIDKRIVVIGVGNSGGDAAVELSRVASKVILSTRTGTWVWPRVYTQGYPIDVITTRRFRGLFPMCIMSPLLKRWLNERFDHARYGLIPNHGPFNAHPIVNDDIPNRIISGALIIKPNVSHFTTTGVYFDDGTFEDDIDCVILATGYTFGFPFVKNCPSLGVTENEVSLYKLVFPPEHPTLCVIGCVQPMGSIISQSELQSRWAARVIKGVCSLPSKSVMNDTILDKRNALKKRYIKSLRHTLQVDWISYMDSIAVEIGVKPNMWKMLVTDPSLALRCFFGPCLPYQYRLVGPGKWSGARDAIITVWDRIHAPMQTRVVPPSPRSAGSTLLLIAIAIAILCIAVLMFL